MAFTLSGIISLFFMIGLIIFFWGGSYYLYSKIKKFPKRKISKVLEYKPSIAIGVISGTFVLIIDRTVSIISSQSPIINTTSEMDFLYSLIDFLYAALVVSGVLIFCLIILEYLLIKQIK